MTTGPKKAPNPTRPLEEIYIRLMASYMTLEDVPENEKKFDQLLDLINFCEDFPGASIEEYREYKDLVLQHGPFERPPVRCLN